MPIPKLSEETIREELQSLPEWEYKDHSLVRTYTFSSFERAIAFMVECTPEIARRNHHPEWRNVYATLDVRCRTHDADNNVTVSDINLARHLERTYQEGYKPRS